MSFFIFFLPIVDTLRLFVIKFSLQTTLKADANHMHHLISNKFNLNFALLSQYILSLCLILLVVFTDINNLFLILLATIIYFICLFKFRKN